MQDEQSIGAAMWIMVIIQTMTAVDLPGRGARKLPAPRAYVPIIVGFGIVQLIADMGFTRAAKALAWITVVSATVLGPFGKMLVSFLDSVAALAAPAPAPAATAPASASTPAAAPAPTPASGLAQVTGIDALLQKIGQSFAATQPGLTGPSVSGPF